MAHLPCKWCGSSDAASEVPNTDGIIKCFSCGKAWKEGGKEVVSSKESFKDERFDEVEEITSRIRGISPNIFKQYNYFKTKDGVHVANMFNTEGKIVAQKFRYPDKTFKWKGNAKAAVPFGMSIWRMGGKRVTITEGEIDCMSVAEALDGRYPVISLSSGAQSAKNELKKHIEYLNSFDEVVLWFDTDEPGRKAVQEVSALFPPGKVYVINSSPYKDANQLLQEKGKAGVLKYYYEAKKYTPSGIVAGSTLQFEEIISFDKSASYDCPYVGINEKLRGFRKGELVTLTAGSGIGKSTLAREIAYDMLHRHKLKVGWVALEENTQRSALGFMGIHLSTPLHLQEVIEEVDKDKLKEAYTEVIATDSLYFYDHWGSLDSDSLLSKLRFLAVGAGVDFIFLDHISIVISGGTNGDNERVAIDNLMTALRSLAEETHVGLIIISHLRRAQGDKGFENGHEVTLSHLRGSGAIAQLSDGVIALERDQQSDEESNIGKVRILKNRYTGETGLAGAVKYYKDEGRLLDYGEYAEEDFKDETHTEF